MSEKSRRVLNNTLTSILVAFMGFFGVALKTFYEDRTNLQQQIVDLTESYRKDRLVLEERISELELRTFELQQLKQDSDILALDLKYKLQTSVNHLDVVQSYIDALPLPAWVKKKRPDGNFEMVMINQAYERKFDISKFEYVGKTDHEIWGVDQGNKFKKIDQLVFDTRRRYCGKGDIVHGTRHDEIDFCKFPLQIGKDYYGVGGVIVSDTIKSINVIQEKNQNITIKP